MAKQRIEIESEGQIFVDGINVGHIDGRSECYVHFKDANGNNCYVARFKYARAKTSAKSWVKCVLQHYTAHQLCDILYHKRSENGNIAPLTLAEKHGYESPNMKMAKKLQAEADARKAANSRPMKLVIIG